MPVVPPPVMTVLTIELLGGVKVDHHVIMAAPVGGCLMWVSVERPSARRYVPLGLIAYFEINKVE